MIASIFIFISNFVLETIKFGGYWGIVFLMTLQSLNIPIPSEIIMSFSGFLAQQGFFNFWLVVLAGTIGNLIGASLSYHLASIIFVNGLRKKYRILQILISDVNLKKAQQWFEKYGTFSIFLGRLVPIVNVFISFPAGLAKMKKSSFYTLTFAGSFFWSLLLTYIGFKLAKKWQIIEAYFREFDIVILIIIILIVVWWIYKHFKNKKIWGKQ